MYQAYDSATENEARAELRAEVECWTWMSRQRKEEVIAFATFQQIDTKFGPVFSTNVPTD